jgi:hypothetical protein
MMFDLEVSVLGDMLSRHGYSMMAMLISLGGCSIGGAALRGKTASP